MLIVALSLQLVLAAMKTQDRMHVLAESLGSAAMCMLMVSVTLNALEMVTTA